MVKKSWNRGLSGNPNSPNYDSRLDYMMGDKNKAKRPEVRKKISDSRKNNPIIFTEVDKKEISERIKREYTNGKRVNQKGWKRSEQACKNMSIGQRRRMKNNPEEWARTCRKSGLVCHQKHPNQSKDNMRKIHEKYPGSKWSEIAKRTNREWKERDPEDYYAKKRSYCKKMLDAREKVKRDDPVAYKEMYKNAGKESFQSILDNSPFYWDDVPFLSNLEREVAKCILTRPVKGVNCHIVIGRKTIDFYPQPGDKMFIGKMVEYHPYDRDLTKEEYYKLRREIIDNSEYKDLELIVITNIKEVKNGSNKESS